MYESVFPHCTTRVEYIEPDGTERVVYDESGPSGTCKLTSNGWLSTIRYTCNTLELVHDPPLSYFVKEVRLTVEYKYTSIDWVELDGYSLLPEPEHLPS